MAGYDREQRLHLRPLFFWAVALGLLGAFQFGFHSGVMNIPENTIKNCDLDGNAPIGLPYCFDGMPLPLRKGLHRKLYLTATCSCLVGQ